MHRPGVFLAIMSCDTLLQASRPFLSTCSAKKEGLLEVPTNSLEMLLCPFQSGTSCTILHVVRYMGVSADISVPKKMYRWQKIDQCSFRELLMFAQLPCPKAT